MTNWTFQVGSTSSETGALTWNPNGTLKTLTINDGFNAGGTQNCDFNPSLATSTGYDDIGRLVGIDCGSGGWGQTFSYDEYDNLTKSVISGRTGVTWNPGYNAANNHYSTGASYDGTGNLTWDTIHTYIWDPYGKLSSIDSSACGTNGECVTYDALGRTVETSYDGVYTEIWYTQLGKVYMKGSSPYYAYWPTPGSGTVEVNGNAVTFYYMHKDWLGSARISSVIVNPAVVSDQAYAPYAEVYDKLATGAGVPAQMFTGDTQDIIAGIFDTPNRELNASQGRWLSPDPAGASWNLYAYATNPNSATDPLGLNPGGLGGNGCQGYPCGPGAGGVWGINCYPGSPCNGGDCSLDGGADAPCSLGMGTGTLSSMFAMNLCGGSCGTHYQWMNSPSWQVVGDNNGTLVPGGCDGCINQEVRVNNWVLVASDPFVTGASVPANNGWSLFGWNAGAWKAFGGSLFSWKNFSAGFMEGGCFQQFAEEAFDPAGDIAGQDAAIKATAQSGAYGAATAYAANQGLIVPMRSSIVRGILDVGEVAGEAIALGATIYSEGAALVNEVKSFQSGQCQ